MDWKLLAFRSANLITGWYAECVNATFDLGTRTLHSTASSDSLVSWSYTGYQGFVTGSDNGSDPSGG
jgi:hypothetical protein